MLPVYFAQLEMKKQVDKIVAYVKDTIKYSISVTNKGNAAANDVVITDLIPVGATYVASSLTSQVAFTGDPTSKITLSNPIAPSQTITLSYEVLINEVPVPNPINNNKAAATFTYKPDSESMDVVNATATSNTSATFVPRYNLGQQVTDIIESIALEEAALAAIVEAESKKIQTVVNMDGVTTQQLMCINKSVSETLDSIALLEGILKQKLSSLSSQLTGPTCM